VMYGDQFKLNGPAAILNQEKIYLQNVGTAPVTNYAWLSPVSIV
jgi:hypothetical protein